MAFGEDNGREVFDVAPAPRPSAVCAVLSVAAILWAPILFGMGLGFTSPAINVMNNTLTKNGDHVNAPADLVVFSGAEAEWYSSLINIGCIPGAVLAGPASERVGRKWTILAIAPFFLVSWLLTGMLSDFTPLIICRLLNGVGVGMSSSVVPTYINEVAPTHLRGAFGAIFQVSIVTGILLVYILGAYVFVDKDGFCQWRHLAYAMVVPSALLLLCGLFVPESPRWLASKGRLEEAERNLLRLRGRGSGANAELEELRQSSAQAGARSSASFRDLQRNPRVVSIGLMLMVIQQFSGVNAIIFFEDKIFQDAGMKNASTLSVWVMLVQVLVTMMSVPLVDTAGRKVLLLIASVGMAVCCAAMCAFFFNHKEPSQLAVVGSFAYLVFFSIGLGPVPWLLMSEIFPQSFRSLASACGASVNWFCSFLTTLSIDPLEKSIGLGGVFAVYGGILVFGTAYIAAFVPETKGRSLAEIELMLGIRQRDPFLVDGCAAPPSL